VGEPVGAIYFRVTAGKGQSLELIRQPKPIADRHFEIEFLEPGLAAFDFTFG